MSARTELVAAEASTRHLISGMCVQIASCVARARAPDRGSHEHHQLVEANSILLRLGAVATWGEFEQSQPSLANAGKALLYQFGVGLASLAIVRWDGGPGAPDVLADPP